MGSTAIPGLFPPREPSSKFDSAAFRGQLSSQFIRGFAVENIIRAVTWPLEQH